MYNGRQKSAFLKTIKSETQRENIKWLFEEVSVYEKNVGEDICNVDFKLYPQIINEIIAPQRFGYFYNLYKYLCTYRVFCAAKQLVDPVIYYSYESDKDLTIEELCQTFIKTSKAVKLRTPDQCIKYFQLNLFPGFESSFELSANEYKLLYIGLKYSGLDDEAISAITEENITDLAGKAYIRIDSKKYIIYDGLIFSLLQKIRQIRKVTQISSTNKKRVMELDYKYLFSYIDDDSQEKRIRRIKKTYQNIVKAASLQEKDVPTISDIVFQGTIYRMCLDEHLAKSCDWESMQPDRWSALYHAYSKSIPPDLMPEDKPKIIKNVALGVEVKQCFLDEYQYLDKNNEWPL